jgi:aminoglycoside N3'-acetyltransferase
LGPVDGSHGEVLVAALLEAVGPGGTVVGLAHTPVAGRSDRSNVFHSDSPCITGGFAATMLKWPGAFRSAHPTNSMVAIGRQAESLLHSHDETSTCFAPICTLIEMNGKMVLIGCVEASPGFSTVHYAYEELGLADKSLLRGLRGAYYERDGQLRWFAKNDVPGCSKGFGAFYPLYRAHGALRTGKVGDADSILIKAADAYNIESPAIRADPRLSLCNRPDCFSCRGTKLFNVRDMWAFYLRHPSRARIFVRAARQALRPAR